MYSLGIVMYEIYSRQDPYKGENLREVLRKVCDRRVSKIRGAETLYRHLWQICLTLFCPY